MEVVWSRFVLPTVLKCFSEQLSLALSGSLGNDHAKSEIIDTAFSRQQSVITENTYYDTMLGTAMNNILWLLCNARTRIPMRL